MTEGSENQKLVTPTYRSNWNDIFKKKPIERDKLIFSLFLDTVDSDVNVVYIDKLKKLILKGGN